MEVTSKKVKKTTLAQAKQHQKKEQQLQLSNDEPFLYKIKQYEASGIAQSLAYMLIRPPRFLYNQNLLLPSYKLKSKFEYEVFEPSKNKQEGLSFPISLYRPKNMQYVILYLHGNSSSRFQGYLHLSALPQKVGLACFDFNGCGLRKEADYITLGKYQSKQVDIAARFLKKKGFKVVGWGRSMGAVSLLLSSQIDIMIADSPFSSLKTVCKQSSSGFLPKVCCCIFHCFYPCVQCYIQKIVQNKSGMNPTQLQITQHVKNIPSNKAILFLAGQQDKMIRSHHSEKLFNAFQGTKKRLIIFDGTHNSTRPKKIQKECISFIHTHLNIQNIDLEKYNETKPIVTKSIKPLPKIPLSRQLKRAAPNIQLTEMEQNSDNYMQFNQTTTKQRSQKQTKLSSVGQGWKINESNFEFRQGDLQEIRIEQKSESQVKNQYRYDLPEITKQQFYEIEQKQSELKGSKIMDKDGDELREK